MIKQLTADRPVKWKKIVQQLIFSCINDANKNYYFLL